MFTSDDSFIPTDANISATKRRHFNHSQSSECSSTLQQDVSIGHSLGNGDDDKSFTRLLPRKSIMTVRTQTDSVSTSDTVLHKRQRKKIRRHLELIAKGLVIQDNQESATIKLSVSFHPEATVREYAIGLVDNPSVSSGVPIGLVGECQREYSYSTQEYDQVSDHCRLVISPKEREVLLNRQGISWKEIHSAIQRTNHVLTERRKKKKILRQCISKTVEIITGPSILSSELLFSSGQRKLIKECVEYSRRARIQYDLEEEAILSSKINTLSLKPSMHVKS